MTALSPGKKAAVLLAAVAVLAVRRPEQFQRPQFWAEDGNLFFLQALTLKSGSLLLPYNGYHHLLLRLAALAGDLLPVAAVPAYYVAIAICAALAVSALCLSSRVPLPPGARVVLALAVTLAPVRHEVFLTLTNAQWILALAQLLVLISSEPASRQQSLFDLLLVALLGLTGPFVVVFLPLYLARAALRRTRAAAALAAVAAACAAVQLVHLHPDRAAGTLADPGLIQVLPALVGPLFGGRLFHLPGSLVVLGLMNLGGLLLYLALARSALRRKAPELLLPLLGGAAVLLSASYAFRGSAGALLASPRYFYIPSVTLLWALAATGTQAARAALALSFAASISMVTRKERLIDYDWPNSSACIGVRTPCRVPLNPPGWVLEVK